MQDEYIIRTNTEPTKGYRMIIDELKKQTYEAQKTQDIIRLGTLRYLLSEVKNKEIELRPQKLEMTDEHVLKVMAKLVKKGDEASEGFKLAGRMDLYDKESGQVVIVKELLHKFAPTTV